MNAHSKAKNRNRPSAEALEARTLLATGVSFADVVREVALDPAGNAYALGEIRNPIDFDPGPGTAWQSPDLPTPSLGRADYLVSYASDGSLRSGWPVQLPFYTSYLGKPLAVDPQGQVYAGGGLSGVGRLAAYDTDGLQVWALTPTVSVGVGGGSFAFFNLASDASGLYAAGNLQGDIQVDLDGDSIIDLSHSSAETDGQFIAKFAAGTHDLDWVTVIRGDSSHGTPVLASNGQTLYASAQFDGYPGIYGYQVLTGTPYEMTEYDLATYTNTAVDSYVIAIDPATGTITNAAHLVDISVTSLAADGTATYLGGASFVNGPGDLDPGPGQRLVNGGFAARFTPSLALTWASELRAGTIADIAVANGMLYSTGEIPPSAASPVDFDPGTATYNLPKLGRFDGFVWALDAGTGAFGWARMVGSTVAAPFNNDAEGGASIAANAAGVYSVGTINFGTADFDRTATYSDNRDLRTNDSDTDGYLVSHLPASGAFQRVIQLGETRRTIDNGDAGYSETGTGWKAVTGNTSGYLSDARIHNKGTGSATARWSFTSLPAGTYEVWSTWIPNSKYATDAKYTINGTAQTFVNQRLAPNDYTDGIYSKAWKVIGTVTVGSDGGSVLVELSDKANGTVIADGMRLVFKTPPALRAASVGSGGMALMIGDEVVPLVKAARRRWGSLGIGTKALHGLSVRIADLSGDRLAEISGRTLTIDTDAAGRGWFVDPTPGRNEEFTRPRSGRQRLRLSSSSETRYDLLTVIAHEMGHALGLGHEGSGVMAETLRPGVRVLPGARLARWFSAQGGRAV